VRQVAPPDVHLLERLALGTDYRSAVDPAAHGIAMDAWALSLGGQHVYYPDHVVFLGATIPADIASGAVAVAVPGAGVLVQKTAKPSVEPMLRCLADVFARLDEKAQLKALTTPEIDALLNWDAEKYRQSLKQP
jgi:rhamnose utilization protein RhaD (predicted bifunctional aldolase and dehydrogenase)